MERNKPKIHIAFVKRINADYYLVCVVDSDIFLMCDFHCFRNELAMAEAHSAVAFSFAITHEGVDVNFDREVLHLVWKSGIRSWRKRLARMQVTY